MSATKFCSCLNFTRKGIYLSNPLDLTAFFPTNIKNRLQFSEIYKPLTVREQINSISEIYDVIDMNALDTSKAFDVFA